MELREDVVCNPLFVKRVYPRGGAALCFVIMPFNKPALERVYRETVTPVLAKFGITCIRGDDIFGVGTLMEEIWGSICRAAFCIAEFTGRNPNVLYEVGIAHTLGKPVLGITQSIDDVPFDVGHLRAIVYEDSEKGRTVLGKTISRTVEEILKRGIAPVPRPAPTLDQKLQHLRELVREERRQFTHVYHAIEQRILGQHAHYKTKIEGLRGRLHSPPTVPQGLVFCPVEGGVISVDYYSEEEEEIATISVEEVKQFHISKYPITNRQYVDFVAGTGHPPPEHWSGDRPKQGQEDLPVIGVSWVDVSSYCVWLSRALQRTVRLPTEAEWLAAAGYGGDRRLYPWGQEWKPDTCNSLEMGLEKHTSVHHFEGVADSPCGCVDMLGNVWEWTIDPFHETSRDGFHWRAVRGGAHYSRMHGIGSLSRLVAFPGHFLFVHDLGFRVVTDRTTPPEGANSEQE